MLPSLKMTVEEHLRYNIDNIPEGLVVALEEEANTVEDLKEELEANRVFYERVEEQVYFAQEILDCIEQAMRNETRCKDLKKAIECIIENSQFER